MDQLYLDIKAKIISVCPEVKFVSMYNGQFEDLEGNGSAIYSFPTPFVLVEFEDDIEWHQLGAGVQIADELLITLHYGDELLDAGDGTMEVNLTIYQKVATLFKGMNKFEPDGAVAFIRNGHTQDKRHTNLYHFQQKYKTNYIDNGRIEPVNGIIQNPPTALEINSNYSIPPITKGL